MSQPRLTFIDIKLTINTNFSASVCLLVGLFNYSLHLTLSRGVVIKYRYKFSLCRFFLRLKGVGRGSELAGRHKMEGIMRGRSNFLLLHLSRSRIRICSMFFIHHEIVFYKAFVIHRESYHVYDGIFV